MTNVSNRRYSNYADARGHFAGSAIYKKVNEIWVQQSDLLNVFDSGTNYKFEF